MAISKKTIRNIALAAALVGVGAVGVPAVAGTLLGGTTISNVARADLQSKLFGSSNMDVVVADIDIPAGGGIDWHYHPGLVVGVVTGGGSLTIVQDDCSERTYHTGQAFTENPYNVHTARNNSGQDLRVRASFYLPKFWSSEPPKPTVFVDADYDDELDDGCDFAD